MMLDCLYLSVPVTCPPVRVFYRSRRSPTWPLPTTFSPSGSQVCHNSSRRPDCCVRHIPVDPSDYPLDASSLGMAHLSIVAPTTLTATSCYGTCYQQHRAARRRRRGRENRRRRRRCSPLESHPLDIWFFDQNQDLMHASLPGLVVSRCGCRRPSHPGSLRSNVFD